MILYAAIIFVIHILAYALGIVDGASRLDRAASLIALILVIPIFGRVFGWW